MKNELTTNQDNKEGLQMKTELNANQNNKEGLQDAK